MAARIRKDDIVVVIAGDHKGARGKVLRVIIREKDRRRWSRASTWSIGTCARRQRTPQGGRIQKEAALHISNVMPDGSEVGSSGPRAV